MSDQPERTAASTAASEDDLLRFYVAARFDTRAALLRDVVAPLERYGHTVTSRWLRLPDGVPALSAQMLAVDETQGAVAGAMDLADIDAADAVVVFSGGPSTTGGYHVEFGYALAAGKTVILVGPPLNVFHVLPEVVRFPTVDAFLAKVAAP